jgi:hypothetical protein
VLLASITPGMGSSDRMTPGTAGIPCPVSHGDNSPIRSYAPMLSAVGGSVFSQRAAGICHANAAVRAATLDSAAAEEPVDADAADAAAVVKRRRIVEVALARSILSSKCARDYYLHDVNRPYSPLQYLRCEVKQCAADLPRLIGCARAGLSKLEYLEIPKVQPCLAIPTTPFDDMDFI